MPFPLSEEAPQVTGSAERGSDQGAGIPS